MKKQIMMLRWLGTVLAVILLAGCDGCGRKPQQSPEQKPTRPAETRLEIGVILPLTGRSAIHGKDCIAGMELAQEEINASGGINGRQLDFIVEDNASEANNTVEAFKKLVSVNKVSIVVGPITSSGTLAAAEVAGREKVVLFSPTAASPNVHGVSPYCFRIGLMTTPQGKRMAEYCYTELGIKSMGILAMNDETGTAYANAFQDAYEALGGKITVRLEYQKTDTEFRTALTSLKNADVRDVYITCVPTTMAYIVRQGTELDYKPRIFANAGVEGEDLITKAGSAADGIVFAGLAPKEEFLKAFEARTSRQPGISGPQGYDATMIVANALKAKGTDREGIRAYFATMPEYDGVGGKISFDETGEVVRTPSLKIVRNGAFVLLKE